MCSLEISQSVLPDSFVNEIVPSSSNKSEMTIIRSNITNMEEIEKWIREFGIKTCTRWNVRSSNPHGVKIVCSKKFVCHHASFMKVKGAENQRGYTKNAVCRASILIQVKKDSPKTRYNDSYVKRGLCGIISVENTHTHTLNTAETLRFLPARNEMRSKFFEYFDDGMGITESHKHHLHTLSLIDNYNENVARGDINPTLRTIRYWHDQWRSLHFGPRHGEGLIEKLKEKQDIYSKTGTTLLYSENPFALVIVTPLMRRAHNLESSKDIAFVDSTSSCDPENHSVTFILTSCAAGAVPLAIVITKGQSYECYCAGFKLLKEAVPEGFFGQKYPHTFLTDHSAAEINAINTTWPQSRTLLCIFHVLQAVWRWLWDKKHNIPKDRRQCLMKNFQKILYSTDTNEAENAFKIAISDLQYPHWTKYITEYWIIKAQWCLAFRDYSCRGHHTNNYCEVSIRLFKDNVLCRVKAYNVLSLTDLTCSALEEYYKNRLTDFANNRSSSARLFLRNMMKKTNYLKQDDIIQETPYEYYVPSEETNSFLYYYVNIRAGYCACPVGISGKFCKHQCAIYVFFDVVTENFPPVTSEDRYRIAKLALGDLTPPKSFYEPFILNKPRLEITSNEFNSLSTEASCSNSNVTTETAKSENVVGSQESTDSDFQAIIETLLHNHNKYGSSISGIDKLNKRLKRITSKGQWETFLHTAGSDISLRRRDGTAIRVQPTTIARRAPHITRGSKRLPAGRPAIGEAGNRKRKRNLGHNVKLNKPNAISHGKNH